MKKFLELIMDQRNYKEERLEPEVYTKARQELLKLNKTSSISEIEFLIDVINNCRSAKDACDTLLLHRNLDSDSMSTEFKIAVITLHVLKAKWHF